MPRGCHLTIQYDKHEILSCSKGLNSLQVQTDITKFHGKLPLEI